MYVFFQIRHGFTRDLPQGITVLFISTQDIEDSKSFKNNGLDLFLSN